ncbi:MAG: ATP-binding protein [Candidatus Accumulibacter sp.]|uniref:ATP-binding protein n=1 Tax=Accumulibacter sp. TaxID=2053492 RepID=UPI0025FD20D2|nr:ATP-binding protein [Accumulibacter sp.]MCM8598989.1 ATP-binding protein [Accumulibacter sp.]
MPDTPGADAATSYTADEHRPTEAALAELLPALQRIDRLLQAAVDVAQRVYGREAASDPYRGLYVADGDAGRLLGTALGQPLLQAAGAELPLAAACADGSRLRRLQRTFALDAFDLDLLLIALAPELDLRYQRLYAYLQDDVTRRRPSVDLVFNLLCRSAVDKIAMRTRLAATAPLRRHGLITLFADAQQLPPPLLAEYLQLDPLLTAYLLGEEVFDPARLPFCELIAGAATWSDAWPVADEIRRALPGVLAGTCAGGRPPSLPRFPRVHLRGSRGIGKRQVAAAIAGQLRTPLLVADLAHFPEPPAEFAAFVGTLLRTALLTGATLYLTGADRLLGDPGFAAWAVLRARLAAHAGAVVLAGTQAWTASGEAGEAFYEVVLPALTDVQRLACWRARLAAAAIALPADEVESLAGRFRLTPEEIAATIAAATHRARWRSAAQDGAPASGAADARVSSEDLLASARAQSGHLLRDLAREVSPRYRWEDIVLPADQFAQLQEICQQARHRHLVYGRWGFARKIAHGRGLNVLFSGPPGTGKTMAADILANDLYLPLYQIDLSQVVSKYIGETEKNLERIFSAAQSANAILFFDEADALFGKRSEVRDAHDRYANIEVGYLLQKMEEYEGVAILATNLRSHMDEAFVRRMQAIVEFPFPDETHRRRIWECLFPQEAPLADDVDFALLAREVKLAGGNIKNIGLAAAFYAAADGRAIAMDDLLRAVRREHQKLGRTWSEPAVGRNRAPAP